MAVQYHPILHASVPMSRRQMHTLTALAAAVAPALQQFMRKTTALQDTSLFLGRATAECLYGCTSGGVCASESSGAEDAEWLDFDMAPYLADDDAAPKAEGTLDLEPCESLVRVVPLVFHTALCSSACVRNRCSCQVLSLLPSLQQESMCSDADALAGLRSRLLSMSS